MKHIKRFENYSINEEEGEFRKFFKGHESKEAEEKAKENFMKALEEAEAEVNKDPKNYVFNKASLEKQAKDNKYLGGLRIKQGGRDTRMFVFYDKGITGFQKLAVGAAGQRRGALGM